MRVLKTAARAVALTAFVVLAVVALVHNWTQVRAVISHMTPATIALALAFVLAGAFASFLSWRSILHDLGQHLPLPSAMRIYFVSQLGKYAPGSVWQPLAQIELGGREGIARRAVAATSVISVLITLGTGLGVALVSVPVIGSANSSRLYLSLAVLPLVAVVLAPPVANRLIALALRLARRESLPHALSARGIFASVGWALSMWALYGVHIWLLARDLGVHAPAMFVRTTGAFAGAWSIGFLVIIAPAGAIAREAALVVLLRGAIAAAKTTAIALVSRLIFTITDIGWALAMLLLVRRKKP